MSEFYVNRDFFVRLKERTTKEITVKQKVNKYKLMILYKIKRNGTKNNQKENIMSYSVCKRSLTRAWASHSDGFFNA
ncbi:hypothetical protein BM607_001720 [Shewanella sp. SACH]|nr:hypothetical protein BM607_001720 [Shewanella sp. SACH]